jgi:beta-aspartyl-peptidase (threonine type)
LISFLYFIAFPKFNPYFYYSIEIRTAMKKFILIFVISILTISAQENPKFGIVLHGGAGSMSKKVISPEQEKEYRAKLNEALDKGFQILKNGGDALDAVESAIQVLENSPLFNAGKGAVLNADGDVELDASIMSGDNLKAGAVAGIKHVKSPIALARLVMEKSPHVMMISDGAEKFAKEMGLEFVENNYFKTDERINDLKKIKEREKETEKEKQKSSINNINTFEKFGTVGVAALDSRGNLAAGTSTGGMSNKKYGRVGDAPIIGAGTYADNKTCAISSTGWGEYFIRLGVAKDISDLMEYKNLSISEAGNEVIQKKLPALGGFGGVIGIDKNGNVLMEFNTPGMFRGYHLEKGDPVIKIFND